MTGSFDGTVIGDEIINLRNVSVFHDGVAFTGNGNLYVYGWYSHLGWHRDSAIASLDGRHNNFHFSDVDYSVTSTFTNLFTVNPLSSPTTNYAEAKYPGLGNPMVNDYGYVPEHWTLTNVTAVPEPEAYAMLLAGLGVVGALARRRRNVGTSTLSDHGACGAYTSRIN